MRVSPKLKADGRMFDTHPTTNPGRICLQEALGCLAVVIEPAAGFSLCLLTLLLLSSFIDKVNRHDVKTLASTLGLNSFLLTSGRKEDSVFQGFDSSLSILKQIVAEKFSSSIS